MKRKVGLLSISPARVIELGMLTLSLVLWAGPSSGAPSFYGTTGLFAVPTAQVAPRGSWSLGANYLDKEFRNGASSISNGTVAHCLTVTLFPRVEVAAVLNNYEGRLGTRRLNHGLTPDRNLGGYTVDRMISAQWLALTQRGSRPALVLGIRDIFGTDQMLKAQYGVASWTLQPFGEARPLTVSAGLGTRTLHGPFGGVDLAITPGVSAIVEGMRGQINGGLRLEPLRHMQVDLAMMGFRSLGGGASYRRRF